MTDSLQLVKGHPFDMQDRPCAGTACALCRSRGHFCPAKGFSGERPLCEACGMLRPCGHEEAVRRMQFGPEEFEVDETGSVHGAVRVIPITDENRIEQPPPEPDAEWRIKLALSAANLRARKPVVTKRRSPAQPSPAQPSPA